MYAMLAITLRQITTHLNTELLQIIITVLHLTIHKLERMTADHIVDMVIHVNENNCKIDLIDEDVVPISVKTCTVICPYLFQRLTVAIFLSALVFMDGPTQFSCPYSFLLSDRTA